MPDGNNEEITGKLDATKKEIDDLKNSLTGKIDSSDEKINRISKRLEEVEKKIETGQSSSTESEPEDEDPVVKKTESLSRISKRLEEVKEKLETGQLKAKESEMVAIEHRLLREAYEKSIEDLLRKSLSLP